MPKHKLEGGFKLSILYYSEKRVEDAKVYSGF